jgi:nucleotide-binding universal stress UspA family protein
MKWIVGLDLRPSSFGALHFASWLAATRVDGEDEQFVGVQVLEQDHLFAELRLRHLDEVLADVRRAARDVLAGEGVADLIRDVEVIQALYADEGLEAAREHHGAAAVVIGRAAERTGAHVIRLGRVARRALRRVWSSIVVVPPDVRERDVGDGPIVAVTDLGARSVSACAFASGLARRLGRAFALVQVAPPAGDGAAAARDGGEALLERWCASHALHPEARAVLHGDPVERAIEFAEAHRAPLLVVEGHRSSAVERVLRRNVSTRIAAASPVPVAVVPSP